MQTPDCWQYVKLEALQGLLLSRAQITEYEMRSRQGHLLSLADMTERETLKLLDWSCSEMQALSGQRQESSMHVCCLRKELKLVLRHLPQLAEKEGFEMPRLLVRWKQDVQNVPDPRQDLISCAWCLGRRLHV